MLKLQDDREAMVPLRSPKGKVVNTVKWVADHLVKQGWTVVTKTNKEVKDGKKED